jgi:hypothetical protein
MEITPLYACLLIFCVFLKYKNTDFYIGLRYNSHLCLSRKVGYPTEYQSHKVWQPFLLSIPRDVYYLCGKLNHLNVRCRTRSSDDILRSNCTWSEHVWAGRCESPVIVAIRRCSLRHCSANGSASNRIKQETLNIKYVRNNILGVSVTRPWSCDTSDVTDFLNYYLTNVR